jgi:hypothetical protein
MVECPDDVRVYHPLLPPVRPSQEVDLRDGVGTPPRSEPVATALEDSFPLRLKGVLDPRLEAPIDDRRDREGPEFGVRLGMYTRRAGLAVQGRKVVR